MPSTEENVEGRTHRRLDYPLSGCVPAEPDSVSSGSIIVTLATPSSYRDRDACRIVNTASKASTGF